MPVSQSNRRLLKNSAQSKLQEANLAIRSASLRIYIAWQLLLFTAVEYGFFLVAPPRSLREKIKFTVTTFTRRTWYCSNLSIRDSLSAAVFRRVPLQETPRGHLKNLAGSPSPAGTWYCSKFIYPGSLERSCFSQGPFEGDPAGTSIESRRITFARRDLVGGIFIYPG
ncbi:hypothetical protein B0I18_107172 [Taibaiella chishuiensis]|uniref:Uncharacterized protein n=1 Tax=Taibaiella chishuiensis TaxID=1434707 RepID=A0A2P8D0M0_9BACT|nr:hypothetical protein B0I18_107172 [Taibaiella chishuiensis]